MALFSLCLLKFKVETGVKFLMIPYPIYVVFRPVQQSFQSLVNQKNANNMRLCYGFRINLIYFSLV